MIKRLHNISIWLVTRRVLQHLAFWSLSFLVLINILRVSAEILKIDVIYTGIFLVPIVLITYINLYALIPFLLEKEKYLPYIISLVILISAGAGFYLFLFQDWIDHLLTGYYFIAYYNFWDISLYFSVFLLLTTLIRLARGWFRLNQLEQEKTISELKALRSQINPHFLFNSLNSIYSLSRKKSDLAPEAVIKLSDVLRYVIYDAETSFISLDDELNFIRKYINLQQLRLDKNLKVDFKIEGESNNFKIAPLLFLPFVENAFKYAPQSESEDRFINILWKIEESGVLFKITNSTGLLNESETQNYKGFGIKNVIKRLEILYPGKHELKIESQNEEYFVNLNIQLS